MEICTQYLGCICLHVIEFLGLLRIYYQKWLKLEEQTQRSKQGHQIVFFTFWNILTIFQKKKKKVPFNWKWIKGSGKWIPSHHPSKSNPMKVMIPSKSPPYSLIIPHLLNNPFLQPILPWILGLQFNVDKQALIVEARDRTKQCAVRTISSTETATSWKDLLFLSTKWTK